MCVPCGSVSVSDGMVIVDISKADVGRVRLNGSTECNEYERSAEKRGVLEEIRHLRLALFGVTAGGEAVSARIDA